MILFTPCIKTFTNQRELPSRTASHPTRISLTSEKSCVVKNHNFFFFELVMGEEIGYRVAMLIAIYNKGSASICSATNNTNSNTTTTYRTAIKIADTARIFKATDTLMRW